MTYLYLFLGLLIFFLNLFDLLVTVLSPTGAGVITDKVNVYGAKLYSFVVGKRGTNKLLDHKVIFLIVTIIIVWIILTWASCSFIFMSNPDSIVNSKTNESATLFEKVYFTGYTLSTLGPGDFKPNGNVWILFTNFVSFFGFIIITVCITYVVPLVSNLTQAKALSLKIAGLGESTTDLLVNSFNGENFNELTSQFSGIAADILKYSTNHLAYPILHYVHQSNKAENIILKMVSLDETLNILSCNIPKRYISHPLGLLELRRSISIYLGTLKNIEPAESAPPLLNFVKIEKSLPIALMNTDPENLNKIYKQLEERRKLHRTNLENDGWNWEEIDTRLHFDLNELREEP